MPTYSYRCQGCSVEFDVHQGFADDALTTCEGCGGALRKLFSAVGVTFNGSGFYRNDSRVASASAATPAKKKSTDSSSSSAAPATSSSSATAGTTPTTGSS